jgi:putative flippase GtrA
MRELMLRQRQLLTYLVGGGASAAIDVGLLQGLLWCGAPFLVAVSAGFIAGLVFNFLFHAHLTFQRGTSRAVLARYLTVVGANYLLTLLCTAASLQLLGWPLPGKLLALVLVAINGYLLGKHWIFK